MQDSLIRNPWWVRNPLSLPCGREKRFPRLAHNQKTLGSTPTSRHSMIVTFIHASSESSDHYYFVYNDDPTDEEIRSRLDALAAEYDDIWYLEHIERFKV